MDRLKGKPKFIIFLFAISALSVSLTSCGNTSSTTAENSDINTTTQESTIDEQNPLNLDDAGVARVNKILDEVGADDAALNALTNCISKYYDDLNATFFDANQREVPMANVQDCTEELNPDVLCRPADNGTGPVCGLANKRTGYSLATIFGYMAG